jgi:hypothetical protein
MKDLEAQLQATLLRAAFSPAKLHQSTGPGARSGVRRASSIVCAPGESYLDAIFD